MRVSVDFDRMLGHRKARLERSSRIRVRHCRELTVWQRSIELVAESCRAAARLPRAEQYGLASQIRRSVVSIAANIAEGHGRLGRGDVVRHLSMAKGSPTELETHPHIAVVLGYSLAIEMKPAQGLCDEVSRPLTAMMRRLLA